LRTVVAGSGVGFVTITFEKIFGFNTGIDEEVYSSGVNLSVNSAAIRMFRQVETITQP